MDITARLDSNEEIKLVLNDYDREKLRDGITTEIAKRLAINLDTNISKKIIETLTENYLELLKAEIDIKIKEVVNAFSGGNYPHVIFKAETIEIWGDKINAEEHVYKKWEALGYRSFYAKTARLSEFDKATIPREALLCLYESNKTGMPDLFIYSKSSYAFIEVKTNGDCLRPDQMLWIKNHPNITVIIFYLEQKIHTKDEDDIIEAQLAINGK